MHILIFCHFGQNRSRYLAEHLIEQGYADVRFAGVKDPDQQKIQAAIDWADAIVTVSHDVRDKLRAAYLLDGKRLIELDVEDRPEAVLSEHRPLDGEEWIAFQRTHVYPALKEQLDEHLPFIP